MQVQPGKGNQSEVSVYDSRRCRVQCDAYKVQHTKSTPIMARGHIAEAEVPLAPSGCLMYRVWEM